MKMIVLILALTTFSVIAHENEYYFVYDDAGNRIVRDHGSSQIRPPDPPAPVEYEIYTDSLAGHGISIFPNPSEGDLKVEITNLTDETSARIELKI